MTRRIDLELCPGRGRTKRIGLDLVREQTEERTIVSQDQVLGDGTTEKTESILGPGSEMTGDGVPDLVRGSEKTRQRDLDLFRDGGRTKKTDHDRVPVEKMIEKTITKRTAREVDLKRKTAKKIIVRLLRLARRLVGRTGLERHPGQKKTVKHILDRLRARMRRKKSPVRSRGKTVM